MNKLNFYFKYAFLLLIVATSVNLNGQTGPDREQVKEKFKAQKVAFITTKLELTEEESQKFWPIYNSYEAELKELRSPKDLKNPKDLTDQEAEAMIYSILDTRSKEIDIQKKYVQKLKSAISPKKIALLFHTEREFKEKVLSNMRERRMQRNDNKE